MAVTLKHFSSKASLFAHFATFLYIFLSYAFCGNADNDRNFHTVSLGGKVLLDCNYTTEKERLWLYNKKDNNVTLFRNMLPIHEPFRNSVNLLKNYSLSIANLSLENDGLYQCVRESEIVANHFLSVEVLPEVNVSITYMSDETIIPTNRFVEVTCLARGSKPAVNLTWLLNNDEVDSAANQAYNISMSEDNNKTFDTVTIFTFQPQSSPLNITCVVHGFGRRTLFNIQYEADYEKRNIFFIGLGIGVLMITSFAFGLFIRRSHSTGSAALNNTPAPDEKSVNIHDNICASHYQDLIRTEEVGNLATDPFEGTFNRGEDISIEDDIVLSENLPGEGIIKYWKAKISSHSTESSTILRKGLSENATSDDQTLFRDMAIRLMAIPKHRNIVETIQIKTKVPYYIYQEYIDNGNLKDFLSNNLNPNVLYDNDASVKSKEVHTKLGKFVIDIVDAMKFLSKEKLRHPALSARKVLLDNLFRCKLYDFWPNSLCISRIQHIIQKQNPAVAWLAPETSSSLQYSEKSDVWSFAILLWEMYSFGDIPYEDMTSAEIGLDIRRSMYLNQPEFCPRNLYDIMLASWRMAPEERPTFASLRKILDNTKEFMDENSKAYETSAYFVLTDDIQENGNVYG